MRSIKRLFFVASVLAVLLALMTVGVVLAQGGLLGGKVLTGSEVTIPAGETIDHDVYVFGGTLVSNGTINGDIVATGGSIDINGPVKGDVLAAGGRVNITGPVTGDVRAAGGQITISGDVSEDVLAAAGQLTLNGRIGQDLIMSTGQLTLAGTVTGGAIGTAGTLTKSGTIGGEDSITVTGDQGQAFTRAPANPVLDTIRQFLEVLLVAVLALWLAPGLYSGAESEVRMRPLASFGWGILAVIGYIVAIVVIAIVMSLLAILLGLLGFGTLVGIDIFGGIILICSLTLAFVIAAAFLVDAIVGLALGRLIAGRSDRVAAAAQRSTAQVPSRWADLGLVVVGAAIVVVLAALPIVGGWVKLVVILLGLGALWRARGGPRFLTSRTEVPPWSTPPAASPPPAAPAS